MSFRFYFCAKILYFVILQAFAATEAMTDRYCIAHKGQQFRFSAENLVSCCDECGNGCNGGFPSAAWEYWVESGIVSGGPYGSDQGCQPYEIGEYNDPFSSMIKTWEF